MGSATHATRLQTIAIEEVVCLVASSRRGFLTIGAQLGFVNDEGFACLGQVKTPALKAVYLQRSVVGLCLSRYASSYCALYTREDSVLYLN